MEERESIDKDREEILPEMGAVNVYRRDEPETSGRTENEEESNPWHVEDTPMYGFWKPAVVLLILGVLAMLLARAIF